MPSAKTVMLGLAAAMSLREVAAYRCPRITTTVTVTVTADANGTVPPVDQATATVSATDGSDDPDYSSMTSVANSSTAASTTPASSASAASSSPAASSSSASASPSAAATSSEAATSSAAASSAAASSTSAASSSSAASTSTIARSSTSATSAAAVATTTAATPTVVKAVKENVSGLNLLLNGDFEQASASGDYDGSPAWSTRGKAKVIASSGELNAASGTHMLYLPIPGYDDYSQATQTVASIQDKHKYTLSYKRKVSSTSSNYADGHCFLIVSMGNMAIESYLLKKSNGWESHTSPAITLRSTDKDLSFHVDCDGSSSGLDAYLDNISLVEAAAAATTSA